MAGVDEPASIRLALVLPVGTVRSMVAATRIVLFFLRTVTRAELSLLLDESTSRPREAMLFVAANVRLAPDDRTGRARLERLVRSVVERHYARQGIRDVEYDLQIL